MVAELSAQLRATGVASAEELARVTPPADRRARGPVAVVECFQEIPCDPCATSCKKGAIKPFVDINDTPSIDFDLCDGCGSCVSSCPGLAVFVIDETYSETEAVVRIPYEFLPLPAAGDRVRGLDRAGESVCDATVVRVQSAKALDHTNIVWLAVPKELSMVVRTLAVSGERG